MKTSSSEKNILAAIRQRFREDNAEPRLIRTFCDTVRRFIRQPSLYIMESDIRAVEDLPSLGLLPEPDDARSLLQQTVVFKLNGGLGTGMGLDRAKSLIEVKPGCSFLDVIARQMTHLRRQTGCAIPLVFMNSFSTEDDTLEALSRYPDLPAGRHPLPLSFLQNRVPKLSQQTLMPAEHPDCPDLLWCPAGHGDFYTALQASRLLDKLLRRGIVYAFISNADNLGATLDTRILRRMADTSCPLLMEVTRRTHADRKGGHVALAADGRLILREAAQYHPDEEVLFQNIQRHRFFNTNNLWINLRHLKNYLDANRGIVSLPIMANRKNLDPRDDHSEPVFQLETAMGAAIQCFPDAQALQVPRSRFVPVKNTNDLLALWSDLFELDDRHHMVANPGRTLPDPVAINLNPRYYKRFADFQERFKHGAPSLLECRELALLGDYYFEAGVRVVGSVTLLEIGAAARVKKNTVLRGEPREHAS